MKKWLAVRFITTRYEYVVQAETELEAEAIAMNLDDEYYDAQEDFDYFTSIEKELTE